MYTKRIKRTILFSYLLDAIIFICIIALFGWGLLALMQRTDKFIRMIEIIGMIAVILLIVMIIYASVKAHAFTKNMKSQNSAVPFDNDHYAAVSKNLSVGNAWLVYQRGNTFYPIAKSNIKAISINGRKAYLSLAIPNGTFVIPVKDPQTENVLSHYCSL